MQDSAPRFEFRAFAQNFGLTEDKIRERSPCDRIRESSEIYVLSACTSENNTKIRGGVMDIKTLIGTEHGLELWSPRLKSEFPMPSATISDQVFPALGVSPPPLTRAAYGLDEYLSEIIRPHASLTEVHVFKRRFGFLVNGCITELAELLVNGAAIRTAAIESEDAQRVLETRQMLGLDEYDNVNYLLALKRIVGMEPPWV